LAAAAELLRPSKDQNNRILSNFTKIEDTWNPADIEQPAELDRQLVKHVGKSPVLYQGHDFTGRGKAPSMKGMGCLAAASFIPYVITVKVNRLQMG
jgi:hypothetical protein